MTTEVSTQNTPFFADIAELLTQARSNAYRTVNSIMVETYWKIGRRIVEEEQNGKTRQPHGTKCRRVAIAGRTGESCRIANIN